MALSLPARNSDLRSAFDVADLAARNWVTLRDAINSARTSFANAGGAVVAINYLVLRANGSVELMSFGPRGGKKTLWKFGRVA